MPARLVKPALVYEIAPPAYDTQLRRLLLETPMGRVREVAFSREPNYFHASQVQGHFVQVIVARDGGRIVGAGTRAIRPTFINGQRVQAGYLGDLRVHPKYRNRFIVGHGYRFLKKLHRDDRASVYFTMIGVKNRPALNALASRRADLPPYVDLGLVKTPMVALGRPKRPIPADISRGTYAVLPEIVAKLNQSRLQFAPAYKEEDFLDGRFRGFRVEDFYVLRRQGKIAGVMGVWDQSLFRQMIVMRYNGLMGALRLLVNLVPGRAMPPAGRAFRHFYLSFVATDQIQDYRALVRHIYNEYAGGPFGHFLLGLHELDSRGIVFREYHHIRFTHRLFAVSFDGMPQLDGRLPYVEPSLM